MATPVTFGAQVTTKRADPKGAAALSDMYGGVDYDRQAIENVFNQATEKEYAAKQSAYNRTAGDYYKNLATSQNSYLDAMRKANAGAIRNGANVGMQNANALSSLLGMSQQSNADATKLAQDARALEDQKAAALTANTTNAMTTANTNKLALGTLDTNQMAVGAQQYAAELGHNAQVQVGNTAASAQQYSADQNLTGVQYNADQNLTGQKYSADQQLTGTKYNADQNLTGTRYAADQSLKGYQAQAAATRSAAASSAAATKYAADKNAAAQQYAANVASMPQEVNALRQYGMDTDSAVAQVLGLAPDTDAGSLIDPAGNSTQSELYTRAWKNQYGING